MKQMTIRTAYLGQLKHAIQLSACMYNDTLPDMHGPWTQARAAAEESRVGRGSTPSEAVLVAKVVLHEGADCCDLALWCDQLLLVQAQLVDGQRVQDVGVGVEAVQPLRGHAVPASEAAQRPHMQATGATALTDVALQGGRAQAGRSAPASPWVSAMPGHTGGVSHATLKHRRPRGEL